MSSIFFNFITESIEWMEFCQRTHQLFGHEDTQISHYFRGNGEKKLLDRENSKWISLDGYAINELGETIALEFLGCHFHACANCGTNPDKKEDELIKTIR